MRATGQDLSTRLLQHTRRLIDPRLLLWAAGAGVLSGIVSVAFRCAIELGGSIVAPAGFEHVPPLFRAVLPLTGTLGAIAIIFVLGRGRLRVGVVHVLEELAGRAPRLPFPNAALQFLAGVVILVFGMPMGREGPAIHLGGATAGLIARWGHLDDSALRILVACGVAAAIAAAFNTPLAGMMLAFEVVLTRYRIDALAPMAVASAIGASLGAFFFVAPAFPVETAVTPSVADAPLLVVCGMGIGICAVLFIRLAALTLRLTRRWPWWLPMVLSAAIASVCGLAVPQILGIGYEVVSNALRGLYAPAVLLSILVLKLIATSIAVGSRMPGGLIGPILLIGAVAGALAAKLGVDIAGSPGLGAGLYGVAGMGAMMGATLRAPLAAIAAAFELSGNPHTLLPTLLMLVVAMLMTRRVLGCDSVFQAQMREMRPEGP